MVAQIGSGPVLKLMAEANSGMPVITSKELFTTTKVSNSYFISPLSIKTPNVRLDGQIGLNNEDY